MQLGTNILIPYSVQKLMPTEYHEDKTKLKHLPQGTVSNQMCLKVFLNLSVISVLPFTNTEFHCHNITCSPPTSCQLLAATMSCSKELLSSGSQSYF